MLTTPVPKCLLLLSWGRAVRRTLKPVTSLEPLMESSRSAVLLTCIPRPMHRIPSELVSTGNAASQRIHREHAPNNVVGKVPVRSCSECNQNTSLWTSSEAECRDSVFVGVLRNTVMQSGLSGPQSTYCRQSSIDSGEIAPPCTPSLARKIPDDSASAG